MAAAQVNYTLDQGATFTASVAAGFTVTGYTAILQLRADPRANNPLLTLTDAAGLAVSGTAVDITITPAQTLALPAGATLCYDLIVTSGGVSTKLQRGFITILPAVSR